MIADAHFDHDANDDDNDSGNLDRDDDDHNGFIDKNINEHLLQLPKKNARYDISMVAEELKCYDEWIRLKFVDFTLGFHGTVSSSGLRYTLSVFHFISPSGRFGRFFGIINRSNRNITVIDALF